jgi:5'-3' exoribonuclease 2
MPKSNHLHKSMLLRGVELPRKALNPGDISLTKNKAARSGRSHGGVPLNGDGGARNSFSFSSSNQHHERSYGNQNGYNGYRNNPVPPPGWQPPPPGTGGFARGPPPPLPNPNGPYGRGQPQAPPGYPQPPPHYSSHSGYPPPPGRLDNQRRGGESYRGSYRGQRYEH